MSKQIFVNLPVRDLERATGFYTAVGEKWRSFTRKPIADARRESEVMLALSADSRQAVDQITDAAGASGGKADVNPKQDHGFMYGRSFEDVDGHIWESVFVDMSQIPARD